MESPSGYHLIVTNNNPDDVALKATNEETIAIHCDGDFLVGGTSDFNGKIDVTHNSTSEAAAKLTNTNTQAAAFALDVVGKARVEKDAAITALEVNNPNAGGYALKVSGKADVSFGGNDSALKVTHSDISEAALEVAGRSYMAIDSVTDTLTLVNFNANGGGLSCQGQLKVKDTIKFSDQNVHAHIDSASGMQLFVNNLPGSSHVVLGKDTGADTSISGALTVKNTIAASDATLNIAQGSWVSNILVGPPSLSTSNTIVQNRLKCQFGLDHQLSGSILPLGAISNGVDLAAATKNTHVKGTLETDEQATFHDPVICERSATVQGTLQVTGAVDLNTTVDLDANIAGVALDVNNASTDPAAVAIRAIAPLAIDARGRSVFSDHMALASDKRLALDGAAGQNYITYNSTAARMEFYIGGTLRFIIDETGGHNP